MKNLSVLIGAIALLSFTACGQIGKKVPAGVSAAFSQKFPEASKVKWGKENATEWEAEFMLHGVEYSANFDESGAWMETEYKIGSSELPAAIQTTLDEQFGEYEIDLAEVTETAEGKLFELGLKKGKEELEITMDNDGKVLKKAQAEEEDEEI
jgi:flagellar motor switch/type III secretory pathway protein FliN